MFVGRKKELDFLKRCYESSGAQLIVVYGRRRVGKTALLQTFTTRHDHTFWTATLNSEEVLRQDFTRAIWQSSRQDRRDPGFTYANWEQAFLAMGDLAKSERHVVVIDEFPYLVNADPSITSVLQKVWDQSLQETKVMLILCGSHIGMMEKELMSYRAPLYGRRTGQIFLKPLPLHDSALFFPKYSTIDQIQTYAILGGIPAYLKQFDQNKSVLKNVEYSILDTGSFLHLEPQFLLREELREPRSYFAILQAIAHGRNRLNEIAQAIGYERSSVSFYLSILQDLLIVERRVPVTERQPQKSRKGIYRMKDPFISFWFRFIPPNLSTLEAGDTNSVRQTVQKNLSTFTGPVFEDLCNQWIIERSAQGRLPFQPERCGTWWQHNMEIDVLAYGEDAAMFGECKWKSRPIGMNTLDELKAKAIPLAKKQGWKRIYYALFSRSGFTPAIVNFAKENNLLLVDPKTLLSDTN
jgi:AAA+ ATPase superfamily predicted ATPase